MRETKTVRMVNAGIVEDGGGSVFVALKVKPYTVSMVSAWSMTEERFVGG